MRLITALSLVLLLGVLGAQCVEHRHGLGRSREIILHNRIIDTKAEDATTDFSREGAEYFYVTFKLNFAGNKENIDQFAEDYGVIFDSFYPMTTYTVYTSYAKAEAISQDAQVLWLGEVPPSDKVPTGLEASSLLVIHWAKAAAEFPGLTEEFADVVARMAEVFPADAFTWSDFNSQSNTAKLQIVDESSFRKIVGWLLTKGSARVKFVDAMPVNTPSSAFATHVVVDGTYDPLKGSGCSTDGTSICLYDTYLNGGSSSVVIDGTGEIIGLVDSGVDVNNCLFYDANFDFNTCDTSNRKIVCYNSNIGKGGNQVDDTGHGSFAAGLACGAAGGSSASADEVASNSAFNGVAPGAQLFVSDVQAGSANSITFDYSNIGSYLDAMYSSGSRIGLFPWGAQINLVGNKAFYSGQDQAFDNYAHAVSDFLFVAPVGNNGLFSVAGTGRIDSPASAKNVIGVGGSLNSHYSFMFSQYLDLTSQAEDLYTELCTIGDFSAYYSTVLCTISGQSSTPCTSFQNVLCFGAFSEPTPDACCQAAYTRPQCCPDTVLGLWSASYSLFSEASGYPQSSRGPTFDYRIKPDVVAPAQRLFSAASSPGSSTPYCGTWSDNIQPISAGTTTTQAATVNEGTSFSAAVVAGTAALIRQYLRAGFYPFGDPAITGSQTFANPSAALVRAIMVNGAESLFQYNANNDAAWKVLSDYISPEVQGHGRINLLNTLMIEPSNIVTTVLFDSGSIPYTNATDKYFFRVPDDTPFIKVTLVWTDPAAAIGAGHALVNNLDVALVRDDGFEYRANRLSEFDYNNNVEHIYAPAPAGRTYSVTVHGAYVPSGPQSYALVISGSLLCPSSLPGSSEYQADQCILDNSDFADAKCPLDCSLRLDACSNGICYCSSPYYGIDCSLTPCPNNCNNNGVCDGETGTCTCNDFWKGDDCSEYNESGNSTSCIYKCPVCDGVNIGITIGVSIGAFLLGLLIAFPFGVWLATHLMLKRKKKMFAKMRAAQQHAQQAQPLHENIEHDSDDE